MKKTLAITDLTRMQAGRVCIAGYDERGRCIRPVLLYPGISEQSLRIGNRALVFPSALVEMVFVEAVPRPPHTEDIAYDPASLRFMQRLPAKVWCSLLKSTLSTSVATIFQQPILNTPGHYVMNGQGARSLGTIRPRYIDQALYQQDATGQWQYRLQFVDQQGDIYRLSVSDLAWRYFHDYQLRQGLAPAYISAAITKWLQDNEVFLRVGLARGWAKFPDRCYLQITGVHTFPDYLAGRTFADLAP